ncbi:hypothetical protein ACFQZC_01990 [Streptacidiphilus monticola]
MIDAPVRGFQVAAGDRLDVAFTVTAPPDMPAGAYWAVVKVMWFGRCQYAPTVELVVAP